MHSNQKKLILRNTGKPCSPLNQINNVFNRLEFNKGKQWGINFLYNFILRRNIFDNKHTVYNWDYFWSVLYVKILNKELPRTKIKESTIKWKLMNLLVENKDPQYIKICFHWIYVNLWI